MGFPMKRFGGMRNHRGAKSVKMRTKLMTDAWQLSYSIVTPTEGS